MTGDFTLTQRIDRLDRRIALKRHAFMGHVREYGRYVRWRLTTPTSLLFAGSMGFVVAEIASERSAAVRAAIETDPERAREEAAAAGKRGFGALLGPLLAVLRFAWAAV